MKASFTFTTSTLVVLNNIGQSLAQTPSGFSPAVNTTASLSFSSAPITAGAYVPLEQTVLSPTVLLPKLSSDSSYVLLMVDLDAPGGITNNTFSPFLHWLTPVSATSSEILSGQNSTFAVAPYISPAPVAGTGIHRYVVVLLSVPSPVFRWPSSFPTFNATNEESRFRFGVGKFATAGGFQPVAANWFTTENKTVMTPNGGYTADAPSSVNARLASAISGVAVLIAVALASI